MLWFTALSTAKISGFFQRKISSRCSSSPPDETVTPLLCFGLGAVPLPPNTSSNNNRTVAPSMSPPRTSPPQQPPPPPPPSVPSPPHTAQHSPPVGTTTAATTAATAVATAAAAAAAAAATAASIRKLTFINNGGVADSMSLFSGNGFAGLSNPKSVRPPQPTGECPCTSGILSCPRRRSQSTPVPVPNSRTNPLPSASPLPTLILRPSVSLIKFTQVFSPLNSMRYPE